jgi:hypothetical protein
MKIKKIYTKVSNNEKKNNNKNKEKEQENKTIQKKL